MYWRFSVNGTNIFHQQSLHKTITIIQVFICPRSRPHTMGIFALSLVTSCPQSPGRIGQTPFRIPLVRVWDRLEIAQSLHQSYADDKQHPLSFSNSNWVFLQVSPLKGVMRFGWQGKLISWYIGPLEKLRHICEVVVIPASNVFTYRYDFSCFNVAPVHSR